MKSMILAQLIFDISDVYCQPATITVYNHVDEQYNGEYTETTDNWDPAYSYSHFGKEDLVTGDVVHLYNWDNSEWYFDNTVQSGPIFDSWNGGYLYGPDTAQDFFESDASHKIWDVTMFFTAEYSSPGPDEDQIEISGHLKSEYNGIYVKSDDDWRDSPHFEKIDGEFSCHLYYYSGWWQLHNHPDAETVDLYDGGYLDSGNDNYAEVFVGVIEDWYCSIPTQYATLIYKRNDGSEEISTWTGESTDEQIIVTYHRISYYDGIYYRKYGDDWNDLAHFATDYEKTHLYYKSSKWRFDFRKQDGSQSWDDGGYIYGSEYYNCDPFIPDQLIEHSLNKISSTAWIELREFTLSEICSDPPIREEEDGAFETFEDFQQIEDVNVIEFYFRNHNSKNQELDVSDFLQWVRPPECCDEYPLFTLSLENTDTGMLCNGDDRSEFEIPESFPQSIERKNYNTFKMYSKYNGVDQELQIYACKNNMIQEGKPIYNDVFNFKIYVNYECSDDLSVILLDDEVPIEFSKDDLQYYLPYSFQEENLSETQNFEIILSDYIGWELNAKQCDQNPEFIISASDPEQETPDECIDSFDSSLSDTIIYMGGHIINIQPSKLTLEGEQLKIIVCYPNYDVSDDQIFEFIIILEVIPEYVDVYTLPNFYTSIEKWTITINNTNEEITESDQITNENQQQNNQEIEIFKSPLAETFSSTNITFEFDNFEPIQHYTTIEEFSQSGDFDFFALIVNKSNINIDEDKGIHEFQVTIIDQYQQNTFTFTLEIDGHESEPEVEEEIIEEQEIQQFIPEIYVPTEQEQMVDDLIGQYNQTETHINEDEEEEIVLVQMGIYEINGDGLVTILFNQKLQVPQFLNKTNQDETIITMEMNEFDLSTIMTILIESQNEESEDSSQNMLEYNITLVDWTQEKLEIQCNFTNPLYVSNGDLPDLFKITVIIPQIFQSLDHPQLFLEMEYWILENQIPKQFPTELNAQQFTNSVSFVKNGATLTIIVQIVAQLILKTNKSKLLYFLLNLQLLTYITVYSISIPANLEVFLQYAISMIEQEFLNPKYILEQFIGPNFEDMKEENEQNVSSNLKASGAVITDFISSLNSYIIIMALGAAGFIAISLIMVVIKNNKLINKMYQNFKKQMCWNGIWGVCSLAYLKCLVQFCSIVRELSGIDELSQEIELDEDETERRYLTEEDTKIDDQKIFFLIFNLLIVLSVPIISLIVLYKIDNNDFRSTIYRKRFESTLYPDVKIAANKKFTMQQLFYPLFIIRRLMFVMVPLLFLSSNVSLQIIYLITMQTFYISYVMIIKPQYKKQNNYTITYEMFYLLYAYNCIFLTDFIDDKSIQFYAGFLLIIVFSVFFLVNFSVMIQSSIQDAKRKRMLKKILDNKKKKMEADLEEAKKKQKEQQIAMENDKKKPFIRNGIKFSKVNQVNPNIFIQENEYDSERERAINLIQPQKDWFSATLIKEETYKFKSSQLLQNMSNKLKQNNLDQEEIDEDQQSLQLIDKYAQKKSQEDQVNQSIQNEIYILDQQNRFDVFNQNTQKHSINNSLQNSPVNKTKRNFLKIQKFDQIPIENQTQNVTFRSLQNNLIQEEQKIQKQAELQQQLQNQNLKNRLEQRKEGSFYNLQNNLIEEEQKIQQETQLSQSQQKQILQNRLQQRRSSMNFNNDQNQQS